MRPTGLLAAMVILASALSVARATPAAATLVDREIALSADAAPWGFKVGPDGNFWAAGFDSNRMIRITPAGAVTEFPLPDGTNPARLTNGPDGAIWFPSTNGTNVGRITTDGTVSMFAIPGFGGGNIASGPDGNLWLASDVNVVKSIFRVTPSGDATAFPVAKFLGIFSGLTAGPANDLYFTELQDQGGKIGRITTDGTVTEYPLPEGYGRAGDIVLGPDGNLWFTMNWGPSTIGRMTPAGEFSQFNASPGSYPHDIAVGPDGNLWFTEEAANQVGRITPDGVITEFSIITPNSDPKGIVAGPDGNIWFVEHAAGRVGHIDLGSPEPRPTVTGLSPSQAPALPRRALTVTGSGFGLVRRVEIGEFPVDFTVQSDTQMTVLSPPLADCPDGERAVRVVGLAGSSQAESAPRFTFACPHVTGISPTSGPLSGGTTVVITGTGFRPVSSVKVGGLSASFVVDSDTQITAVTPAPSNCPSSAAILLSGSSGTSTPNASSTFTFDTSTCPTLSEIAPSQGPSAGGTVVTITGINLGGATAVRFEGTSATSVTQISSTEVRAVTPALPGGYYRVAVTTPYGTTAEVDSEEFFSVAPLAVTGVTPPAGDPDGIEWGGVISGSGFSTTSAVTLGGTNVDFYAESDSKIDFNIPAHDPGTVDVIVTNAEGSSAPGPSARFTYAPVPVITDMTPTSGPAAGGTIVVIHGRRLSGTNQIAFGSVTLGCPAACQVVSDTEVRAVAPAQPSGLVQVRLTTPIGTSDGRTFVYAGAGTFAPAGECPNGGCAGAMVVLHDGKVLRAGNGSSDLFDPLTGTWSPTAGTCGDQCGSGPLTLTVLPDGPPSACGDRCGDVLLTNLGYGTLLYDHETKTWAPGPDAGWQTAAATATLLDDGTVLIAGGRSENFYLATDIAALYHPASNSIDPIEPMHNGRWNATATRLPDGRVLVAGGRSGQFTSGRPEAEIFDPRTGHWTAVAPMAQARQLAAAALLDDGRVLVAGGTGPFDSAEMYDPATDEWSPARSMAFTRGAPAAAKLGDGRVLLVGGDNDNPTSMGEVFDPVPNRWTPTPPALRTSPKPCCFGVFDHQASAVRLPSGPSSVCATRCGQVLVTPGKSRGDDPPTAVLYAPAPKATVAPQSGPIAGGTAVTLEGSGLASISSVTFGGTPAAKVTPDSATPDTKVVAVAPASTAGPAEVKVTTAGGTAVAGTFTFVAPAPPPGPAVPTGGAGPTQTNPVIGTPGPQQGYSLVGADGGVFNFGNAVFAGSVAGAHLDQAVVAIEKTPSGRGYWMATASGGVLAFGDARSFGSTGGIRLAKPIVGMRATPSGNGYWLVASDGGVFAFGDARYFGSTGALRLVAPVVGLERSASGNGYWLVAADGGVFAFGDAPFRGSTGALRLAQPVVAMSRTASGNGYLLVASDGGVFAFGDAAFRGSTGALRLNSTIVGLAQAPQGAGYWLCGRDGGVFAFGTAQFLGSMGGSRLSQPVTGCT